MWEMGFLSPVSWRKNYDRLRRWKAWELLYKTSCCSIHSVTFSQPQANFKRSHRFLDSNEEWLQSWEQSSVDSINCDYTRLVDWGTIIRRTSESNTHCCLSRKSSGRDRSQSSSIRASLPSKLPLFKRKGYSGLQVRAIVGCRSKICTNRLREGKNDLTNSWESHCSCTYIEGEQRSNWCIINFHSVSTNNIIMEWMEHSTVQTATVFGKFD